MRLMLARTFMTDSLTASCPASGKACEYTGSEGESARGEEANFGPIESLAFQALFLQSRARASLVGRNSASAADFAPSGHRAARTLDGQDRFCTHRHGRQQTCSKGNLALRNARIVPLLHANGKMENICPTQIVVLGQMQYEQIADSLLCRHLPQIIYPAP
jgi:hypothetical protein